MHILEELERLENLIEEDENHSVELNLRMSLKAELLEIVKLDERNLIKKSKLSWLKLGDENTSFFHHFLSAKKKGRENLISELTDDQDISTTSFREIERMILNFYSSLYTKLPSAGSVPILFDWRRVSAAQNINLIARFSAEEIWHALKNLGKNKALGPDGSS